MGLGVTKPLDLDGGSVLVREFENAMALLKIHLHDPGEANNRHFLMVHIVDDGLGAPCS